MDDSSDTLSENTQSTSAGESQQRYIVEHICAERRIFNAEDVNDNEGHIQYHVHWENWPLGEWDDNELGDLKLEDIERRPPCWIAQHEKKTEYSNTQLEPGHDCDDLVQLSMLLSDQLGAESSVVLGILAAVPQQLLTYLISGPRPIGPQSDSLQQYFEDNKQIENVPCVYMVEFVHAQTGLAPTIAELRQCLSEEVKPPNLNVQHRLDCMEEFLDKLYELDWDPAAVCPAPPRYIGVAYDWKRRQAQHSSGNSSNLVLKHMSRVPALQQFYTQKFSIIFAIYASDQLKIGEQVFHALCPMTCNTARPGGSKHSNEALLDRTDMSWRQRELAVFNGPYFRNNIMKIKEQQEKKLADAQNELSALTAVDARESANLDLLKATIRLAEDESIVEELEKEIEQLSIS